MNTNTKVSTSSIFRPRPSGRRCACCGFTLLEILVVMAIIMLLAGLILAGLNVARYRAQALRARRDIEQLKTAWDTYYADYSRFPEIGDNSREGGQIVSGEDVVQILRGRENHNGQNPKRIPYMDFHQKTTEFQDPWGNRYRIALDENGDGEVSARGETLPMSVAVWSTGPDLQNNTGDDVLSWREGQ